MTTELVVTKTLIGQADDIAAAHERFTAHYVVGGRSALYTLLGEMLNVINCIEASSERNRLIKIIKDRLRDKFGIKTQKNTSDLAVLVRYMTRADRKTVHVYTRVIEAAKKSGIQPGQLPSFIEGAGGIERIRALGADGAEDTLDMSERIALTEEYLSCRTELPLAHFDANELLDLYGSKSSAFSYFVCTRTCSGQFYVLSPLPPTAEFERIATRHLSTLVCEDINRAREGIANLRRRANEEIRRRRENERDGPSPSAEQQISNV